jgi:hypothetical protein
VLLPHILQCLQGVASVGLHAGSAPVGAELGEEDCNDIDRKANAHLLRDFERRLDEDPRLSEHSDDSDYSCDEPPPETETEHEQHTTLPPEHQVEKAKTIGGSGMDLPRRARTTVKSKSNTWRLTRCLFLASSRSAV